MKCLSKLAAKILKKHDEILMTGKAFNNRVILEWLAHILKAARINAPDPRVEYMFLAMMLDSTWQ